MGSNQYQTNTISIVGYNFSGPFNDVGAILDLAGIYVILDKRVDGQWYVIDVGESAGIQSRIKAHDRKDSWIRCRKGTLGVAVLYTGTWTDQQRRDLEFTIRQQFNPPCGDR